MPSEAELKRRDSANQLRDWTLVDDAANVDTGVSDPSIEFGVRSRLDDALTKLDTVIGHLATTVTELQNALKEGGSVLVNNLPATYPNGHTQPLTNTQLRLADVEVNDDDAHNLLNSVVTTLTGTILNKLNDIFGAVDGLEATAENIEINSDTINLNTDEVELLLQQVRDKVTELDNATGNTTDAETLNTVVGRLKRVVTLLGGVATQSTLASVLTELQGTLDVAVGNFPAEYPLPAGQVSALTPQADALTNGQLRDSPVPVTEPQIVATLGNRYSGGKTSYAALVSSAGDNIAIDPAPGNAIRVWWVSFVPDPDNASNPLVTVKFDGGITMYVGYAMAHWEKFEGDADQDVIVNLSETRSVAVTIHYEEYTP